MDVDDTKVLMPETITNYRVVRLLGSGGMGDVYLAVDRRTDQDVAIKVMKPNLTEVPTFRERFEREAHIAALLRSPYTAHLLDYGFAEGRYFLVMQFVEGRTLRDVLQAEGKLDVQRACRICAQVARALEEGQARGVVHRDIKPENIMIGANDSVRVLDFGVARHEGGGELTSPGLFVGTAAYTAPENTVGYADARSDIYSLGATFYECVAGRPPFLGDPWKVLREHQSTPVPLDPIAHLPNAIVAILRRCLAKDADERYQAASALAADLERAAVTVTAGDPPFSETPRYVPANVPAMASSSPPPQSYAPPLTGVGLTGVPAVSMAMRAKQSRAGGTSYDLVVRNTSAEPAAVSIGINDPQNRLSVSVPGQVTVPPNSEIVVPVQAAPRSRPVVGTGTEVPFAVVGQVAGGAPVAAGAAVRVRPVANTMLLSVIGIVAVAALALGLFLALGGGGSGGTNTPTVAATSGTQAAFAGKIALGLFCTDTNVCVDNGGTINVDACPQELISNVTIDGFPGGDGVRLNVLFKRGSTEISNSGYDEDRTSGPTTGKVFAAAGKPLVSGDYTAQWRRDGSETPLASGGFHLTCKS
jgi:serine/threonine protein kinase